MDDDRCAVGVGWCARADAMFGAEGLHVLDVHRGDHGLEIVVETDPEPVGCPSCGVIAAGHGRRQVAAADAPCFGLSVRVVWRKRVWRCPEPACTARTWSETHPLIGPRAALTSRAVTWATDALAHDDTTVSALARHLRVDWHTLWHAVAGEARRRLAEPRRLVGVHTLGVDEHIWRPRHRGAGRAVTAMVDLTRDQHGQLHARLLDVVPGRSGTAYAAWLARQDTQFRAGVKHAALDPFRGYANALRDELPDAVAVLDAFHVVKLGTQVVDEVRRRCQQNTLGRRGHKDDPLYKIRGLLRHGREHLTPTQIARVQAGLAAGDPTDAVAVAWSCYQQLRSAYTATNPATGRQVAEQVLASFPSCPIPEVARLGRTLRAWRTQLLAYFSTAGVSNGGTEAINLIIEKTRRLAHGFRSFRNYRIRILLVADASRPYRPRPNHA
jgi:transposase